MTATATTSDPGECLCLNMRRAARALSRRYDAALGSSGLSIAQFGLLSMIARRGPLSLADVAALLVLEKSTVTRNVAGLCAAGYCRSSAGSDRRQKLVEITPAGREALARARPMWRSAQRALAQELGPERWHRLLSEARLLAARETPRSNSA